MQTYHPIIEGNVSTQVQMSSNQRPTKVRVLSSQSRSHMPARRRGDVPSPDSADRGDISPEAAELQAQEQAQAERAALAASAAAQGMSWGQRIGYFLLFLIGCAVGGAALTMIG
jgi:hypothetical protein